MLEPTTLPMAMSLCPLSAATTDVASSGRLVPAARIVSPMTASLRPAASAIETAPVTSIRAPATRSTSPPATNSASRQSGPAADGMAASASAWTSGASRRAAQSV